jgi:hypothetical protein
MHITTEPGRMAARAWIAHGHCGLDHCQQGWCSRRDAAPVRPYDRGGFMRRCRETAPRLENLVLLPGGQYWRLERP